MREKDDRHQQKKLDGFLRPRAEMDAAAGASTAPDVDMEVRLPTATRSQRTFVYVTGQRCVLLPTMSLAHDTHRQLGEHNCDMEDM